MQFLRSCLRQPDRLGVFPGTFNPVTVAHLALAEAALGVVDQVLFVLPRHLPHKTYSGVPFDQRLELLQMALGENPRFSAAVSEGGLFAEIAAECHSAYGQAVRLSFLCGSDAAERIATWDYGCPAAFSEMLIGFDLLVASRGGEYHPPESLSRSFASLELNGAFDHVSASEVRARITAGQPWEHLVPANVRCRAGQLYAPGKKLPTDL
jgi:nicotinate-nucleotide adenylyltransferase